MNEPIRVLHVVTHMNRGGLENMIMNYYRNIDRNRVQFDFLTHRPQTEKKDFDDEIHSLGGKIYHLPTLNPFSATYLKALDTFFKNHKQYQIIHVHQDCLSGIILHCAKKNGIPVRIAHCHNSNQDKNLKYLVKLIYKKGIKYEATKLFACGEKAGKWMFETNRFEVLPNAISAKAYRYNLKIRKEIRKKMNLENSFIIGNVARFCKVKNQVFLVDIFEELHKSQKEAILFLVGDGEMRKEVQEYVKSKNLEKYVLFLGVRDDIPQLMQAMDVFVLPSLYEGLPVTMVEAQAAGLPCVISDKVPSDCIITDLVTQISLKKNVKYWANKIGEMKNINRRNTFKDIVKEKFDITENAKKLEKYYQSVLT